MKNKDNCSESTSKMLRISSVWRIRQNKISKNSLKNASILHLFYEILLGYEQLHIIYQLHLSAIFSFSA